MTRRKVGMRVFHRCLLGIGLAGSLFSNALAAEPPIQMADPNGQDLILEDLDVRVAAHGPLSFTELEMVFRNPKGRQVEGRFLCRLPTGATVSRFAKEVNGKLMEGEVVERLKAERVYTEILHTMRDPALLQQDQGNQFQAKVFPIPASGKVRLLLSYSHLAKTDSKGSRQVVVPLAGMNQVGNFSASLVARTLPREKLELVGWFGTPKKTKVEGEEVYRRSFTKKDFEAREDLWFRFDSEAEPGSSQLVETEDFAMLVARPKGIPTQESRLQPDIIRVFLDTSASQAQSAEHRREVYRGLVKRLAGQGPNTSIEVYGFDLEVRSLAQLQGGSSKGFQRFEKALEEEHFLGATHLENLMTWMKDAMWKRRNHILNVVVTDGVPTMGERDFGALLRTLGDVRERHTVQVLVVGGVQETRFTQPLAKAGRGRVLEVPLSTAWEEKLTFAVGEFFRPLGPTYQLEVEGADWAIPSRFEDLQPGSELVSFVKLSGKKPKFQLSGSKAAVDLEPVVERVPSFGPLLEREAFRAYLGDLEHQAQETADAKTRSRLQREQVRISTERRVLCPLTSLLVLETEADYRRFEIDRRALKDILVISDGGVHLRKRAADKDLGGKLKEEFKELPKSRAKKAPGFLEKAASTLGSAVEQLAGGLDFRRGPEDDHRLENRSAPIESLSELSGAPPSPARQESIQIERSIGDFSEREARPRAPRAPRPSAPLRRAMSSPPPPVLEARELPSGGNAEGGLGEAQGFSDAPDEDSFSGGMADDAIEDSGGSDGFSMDVSSEEEALEDPAPEPELERDEHVRFDFQDGRIRAANRAQAERRQRHDRLRRTEVSGALRRTLAQAPAKKFQAPAWMSQAEWTPSSGLLKGLSQQIEANPKDRALRNALAWSLVRKGDAEALYQAARSWQPFDVRNPMVYEYFGLAFEGLSKQELAKRAFSSIAEISPGDSGLLNRAGFLSLRSGHAALAETVFRYAIDRRPEHANNYRGLALAQWMQGKHGEALETYDQALKQQYHSRYGNVTRVLREEAAQVLRAWAQVDPKAAQAALAKRPQLEVKRRDDMRITLHWETDANDVDLHAVDPNLEECFYSHRRNQSGMNLYEDLTRGLGPEVISVPEGSILGGAYHVGVKYFSAGPMGVSRGVVVISHPAQDGRPDVTIHPFTLIPDLEGQRQDMRHIAKVEITP